MQLSLLKAAAVAAVSTLIVSLAGPAAAAPGPRVPVCFAPTTGHRFEFDLRLTPATAQRVIRATKSYPGPCASYGDSAALGNGRAWAFSQSRHGVPSAIGVAMTTSALTGLPDDPPTAGRWCYDANADGTVDQHAECTGGYEFSMKLSRQFRTTVDTPFQYALLNWNPMGHLPMGVYDRPHFDVHFYTTPEEERLAIRPGPCGMLTNCDDYQVGSMPVPARYLPADYSDFGAVEPGMGNHLIDLTGPEMNGSPFTRTFIYGSYGGSLTFWEPMVASSHYQDLIDGRTPDSCTDIKQPQAYETAGWYPTRYCVRYRANREEVVTTLEGFVRRSAG